MSLLHVENLNVQFDSFSGSFNAVEEFSIKVDYGEIHGIIGESGSGKSIAVKAILGLLPKNARISADHLMLDGVNLLRLSASKRREVICEKMSIIFQNAENALDPSFTVGYQLLETIKVHHDSQRAHRKKYALELLESVGFRHPDQIVNQYAHQLDSAMIQRAVIAITLASKPKLLVADEPTFGLDPGSQLQINDLLLRLNVENEMSILLITHEFPVLSLRSDKLTVMYCGQVMETGNSYDLLSHPRHPYTKALLDSVPSFGLNDKKRSRLVSLKGVVPPLNYLPVGCPLGPRCPRADKECVEKPILQKNVTQPTRCHFPIEY